MVVGFVNLDLVVVSFDTCQHSSANAGSGPPVRGACTSMVCTRPPCSAFYLDLLSRCLSRLCSSTVLLLSSSLHPLFLLHSSPIRPSLVLHSSSSLFFSHLPSSFSHPPSSSLTLPHLLPFPPTLNTPTTPTPPTLPTPHTPPPTPHTHKSSPYQYPLLRSAGTVRGAAAARLARRSRARAAPGRTTQDTTAAGGRAALRAPCRIGQQDCRCLVFQGHGLVPSGHCWRGRGRGRRRGRSVLPTEASIHGIQQVGQGQDRPTKDRRTPEVATTQCGVIERGLPPSVPRCHSSRKEVALGKVRRHVAIASSGRGR